MDEQRDSSVVWRGLDREHLLAPIASPSCSCPAVVRLNHEPHRPGCPWAASHVKQLAERLAICRRAINELSRMRDRYSNHMDGCRGPYLNADADALMNSEDALMLLRVLVLGEEDNEMQAASARLMADYR